VVLNGLDSGLIERVRAGDRDALGEVYARHGSAVFGLASGLCGPLRAEQVTRDVFVALWNHPDAFEPECESLRSHLLAQARARATSDPGVSVSAHGPDLGSMVLSRFAGLAPRDAAAVSLTVVGGFTPEEAADLLRCSAASVTKSVRSGLLQLAEAARRDGSADDD